MPLRPWTKFGLTLPLFALALGLAGDPPQNFPVGSYDSDAYTLVFESTGGFRYMLGDRLMVRGEYAVRDSTIAFTDESGPDACLGAERNPGTYHWDQVGKGLQFRPILDPCAARIPGLANQTWRPHATR